MILDKLLVLSDAQSLDTQSTASTNVIDLVNARDIGEGENPEMRILCLVGTAFATTNAGTLTIQAQGSTDNATYTTYAASPAYTAADLTAGRMVFRTTWPSRPSGGALPRYLRMNYVLANAFTAGTITSTIVLDRQGYTAYPAGFSAPL